MGRHVCASSASTSAPPTARVASVDPLEGPSAPVEDFPVPQLVRAGRGRARGRCCPRASMCPRAMSSPAESLPLPWGDAGRDGRWASSPAGRAREVPGPAGRLRQELAVPPGRGSLRRPSFRGALRADVAEALPGRGLRRCCSRTWRSAWNHAHPDAPLAQQEVVITVPASFDEAARALTVSAARKAGLEKFTLLEEPQAAFYDFTARHRTDLAQGARRRARWCWWWTWAAAPPTSRWCTRASRPRARCCGGSPWAST